jgi:hypothetical protein
MSKLTLKSNTMKYRLLLVAVAAGCFIFSSCGGSQSSRSGSSSGSSGYSGSSYDREAQREIDREYERKRAQIDAEERRWNEQKRQMDAEAAKSRY